MKTLLTTTAVAGLILIQGCGDTGRSAAPKDVATDFGTIFQHYLYYRQGRDLIQAACNSNTIIYDRASCRMTSHAVPAERFYHELQTDSGAHAEELTARAAEAFVRVEQVDTQLAQLVNSSGQTPQRPDLAEQIRGAVDEQSAATAQVVGIREQVARIQQALARGDDPELRLQLADLEVDLAGAIDRLNTVRNRLDELRRLYAEANAGLIDAQMYQHLLGQRDRAVQVWAAYQGYLANEARESVRLRRVIAMIEDQAVYVEDTGSSSDFMGIIFDFDHLVRNLSTQPVRFGSVREAGATDVAVNVSVATGVLKTMQCRFATTVENRCVQVRVAGPNGAAGVMDNLYIQTRQSEGVSTNSLINVTAPGEWRFQLVPVCDALPPPVLGEPWCELGVDLP